MKTSTLTLLIITALLSTPCQATITLPAIFSDGMVLQQKSEAAFWGKADPGEKITITTGWSVTVSTIAGADGKWQAVLQTPDAGGPYEVRLTGSNSLVLKDVLVGEVWLCSGQSNMAFKLKGAENAAEEIAVADYPHIRFLNVSHQYGDEPFDDVTGSVWEEPSPRMAAGLSAVAYFFAKRLYEELDVPVGIIHASWGGTPAEAWTPEPVLSGDPELAVYFKRWKDIEEQAGNDSILYNAALRKWQASRKTADSAVVKKPKESKSLYYAKRPWREPSVLYNGMIHPLAPYSVKGVLWYQGESNVAYADEYYHLFKAMIKSWRREWKADLPFYFVQLAPFGYSDLEAAARLREAQHEVSKTLPGTGMVATADIGNMADAHPVQKREVGQRLALMTLARNYGKSGVIDKGPEVKSIQCRDGKVYLRFDQPIRITKGNSPQGFALGYNDEETGKILYVKATAKLENNKIVLWCDESDSPVEIRYAWLLANDGNISNLTELPAYPFRKAIQNNDR